MFELREVRCWNCGCPGEAAIGQNCPDNDPRPGDPTICGVCTAVGIFDEEMAPRRPTEEEIREKGLDGPDILSLRRHVRNMTIKRTACLN